MPLSCATEYALLVAERTRNGHPISTEDGQIAAIALSHELPLATRNSKDFKGIEGLIALNPWEYSPIYETEDTAIAKTAGALSALTADNDTVISIQDGRRFRVRHGTLDNGGDPEGIWRVATQATGQWLATVEANTWDTFRRIGRIRVGVKSTADKVFIRNDWIDLPGGRPELLRPLITRKCACRFKADVPAKAKYLKEILYPHEVTENGRAAVDLSLYPIAASYLEEQCYWLQCKNKDEQDLLWLALAVANSTFIEVFYDHRFNNKLYNRQVVFAQEEDFRNYFENLHELKALYNRLEGRSGTLWESRYKSSPVQTDQYLLACCRYIELNPARARMVDHPGGYHWSSYTARMGGEGNEWLDIDPMYQSLGDEDAIRRRRYQIFLEETIPPGEWELIQGAVKQSQLTGNSRFADAVEQIVGRRIERRGSGRPVKNGAEKVKNVGND